MTADGCKNVLNTLNVILVKYEGLKANGEAGVAKKLWQIWIESGGIRCYTGKAPYIYFGHLRHSRHDADKGR